MFAAAGDGFLAEFPSSVLALRCVLALQDRGQAHAILTRLGVAEPPPLDLLIMQREQARHRAA